MVASNYTAVILSTFLLGFTGGFAHCVAMCHPFVLYISSKYPLPGYRMLIPQLKYNLGRITSYTLLGAAIGVIGNLSIFNDYLIIQKILSIAAGVVLILFAFSNSLNFHPKIPLLGLLSRIPTPNSAYLTGCILGFLPCGLVLGAIITSAMAKGAVTGGISMAMFGLGTSIAMLLLAMFGGLFMRYLSLAKLFFTIILLISGVLFIIAGIRLS